MKEEYTPEFEAFWAAYPRRISKKAAFRSFRNAIRDGVQLDKILSAVESYKVWLKSDGWRPEPKHPTTWLNQGCWDDEYDEPKEEPKRISISIEISVLEKLRRCGFTDMQIKSWFEDASYCDDSISFKSVFMRDYVAQHFEGQLMRGFGILPKLMIDKNTAH